MLFDGRRRSRNIGTSAQGHGQENRFVVPDRWSSDRRWYELVGSHQIERRVVHGRELSFLIEEPLMGFLHACSLESICQVLELLPSDDLAGLGAIFLRQPTRKQHASEPIWGRLTCFADVGRSQRKPVYEGALVTLEAQKLETIFRWSKSQDPESLKELERLRVDGHRVEDVGRAFMITYSLRAIRRTQLRRTLIHEVGHWVDFLEKVERPSHNIESSKTLSERYFQRPTQERERFANRYADRFLERNGVALEAVLNAGEEPMHG